MNSVHASVNPARRSATYTRAAWLFLLVCTLFFHGCGCKKCGTNASVKAADITTSKEKAPPAKAPAPAPVKK